MANTNKYFGNPMGNPTRAVPVGNPNLASMTSSTLEMLDRVPSMSQMMCQTDFTGSGHSVSTSYMLSNSEAVGTPSCTATGTSNVASQPAMAFQRNSMMSFEKLAPKSMSTNPGPMGTDYKS